MQLQLVRDFQTIQGVSNEWNSLVRSSATDVPFLHFEYLENWWATLGGGEWKAAELRIILARDENGQLQGIAPLFRTATADGSFAYMFIGSIEISDYLDFIVAPENQFLFAQELFEYLDQLDRSEWTLLDLYNFPEWSARPGIYADISESRGWEVHKERLQPCPMITLDGDWETYLKSLTKKQRHELRRKLRNSESHPEGVSLRIVTKEDPIEQEIDNYLQLMSYDPRKENFLNPKMIANIRDLIQIALDGDWLMLAFLEAGGNPIAANMNFDYANRIWVYNSGIHPDYLKLSPGWVLLGRTIQWAIQNGRDALDFMRGDEEYKYRLGGKNRFVTRLQIHR
jgi:CelD/BcsL family acetyltransferase involved in cellulose biosynthesis